MDEPDDVEVLESALAGKSAGVLRRLDYGSIALPSGRLIAVDPATQSDDVESLSLPPGTYPVFVLLNERLWAYAAIVLGDAVPVAWQEPDAVPVDTGAACFMSAEAFESFLAWRPPGSDLMKELWDPFYAATQGPEHGQSGSESPPKPFHLRVDDDPSHAIPIFHSGYGDGVYPLWIGCDAAGVPCRILLDFHVGVE